MNENPSNETPIFDSTYKQDWYTKGVDIHLKSPIKLKRISFDKLQTNISAAIDAQFTPVIESTSTKILKFDLIDPSSGSTGGDLVMTTEIIGLSLTELALTEIESILAEVFDTVIGNAARVAVKITSVLVEKNTHTLSFTVTKFIDWENYNPDQPF